MGIIAVIGFSTLFVYRYVFIPVLQLLFTIKNLRCPATKVPPLQDHPILNLSAVEISNKVKKRELQAVDVMCAFIERIKAVNGIINAVVDDRFADALKEAQEIDRLLDKNDAHLLTLPFVGVPFTVKVAFGVKDLCQSSGLVLRKDVKAEKDALQVSRLREAGGVPVCVSNVSELCMWWESANLLHGRTCNPYDNRRIVGGSSGGEGALIAAGASVIGLGSDIGGSIRMPAFFNGVYGHKCTSGMIPNEGQFPNADGGAKEYMVSGPLVRYSADLLPSVRVMAGPQNSELMQLDREVDFKSLVYYYMEDIGDYWFTTPVDHDIRKKLQTIVKELQRSGYDVRRLSLEDMKHSFQIWSAKMGSVEQTRFCRLMGNIEHDVNPFLEAVKKLFFLSNHTIPAILLGIAEKFTLMADAENQKLVKKCTKLGEDLDKTLDGNGCLLLPTHPTAAPYHNWPLFVSPNFAYTGIFNVLGLPATAVPLGLDSKGVPIGIQVVARKFEDFLTLKVAKMIGDRFGGWVAP